jgi:phosphoribosylaminoimidazolecarboxamide formyltransferase/IMP cyclohydrolase
VRALLSVYDKEGLAELAQGLADLGWELVASGNTSAKLTEEGIAHREVAEVTGSPEMLGGRVKTLHPKIHGGILADRSRSEHMDDLAAQGIDVIDLVVCNLYPFRSDPSIELIDVGGPTMVRAAAKNHAHVGVVVDPADYPALLDELRANGTALSLATRFRLAQKAFAHTAAYDGAISSYLGVRDVTGAATAFAARWNWQGTKVDDLRYGENPHQRAALYRDDPPLAGSIATFRQLQGKELSYNNIADGDAAWECVQTFAEPACAIVKHANPCGVAIASDMLVAYRKAFATDPTSAFGGIIAFNREVDAATLEAVSAQFVEVLIAPGYAPDALPVIAAKANVRVLAIAGAAGDGSAWDMKSVGGGMLVQTKDARNVRPEELKVVTRKAPTAEQWADLLFAWRVAKYVKSNAIVYCAAGRTLGIGAGQMSRVDSTRIAALKAANAGLSLAGSSVASDAFFPFRDGIDVVADNGAIAVVQPGGSVRDGEVIAAADERGLAMVFTGIRHFRH